MALISFSCFSKKKQNKKQELEKIGVIQVLTIGDCELCSLLINEALKGADLKWDILDPVPGS